VGLFSKDLAMLKEPNKWKIVSVKPEQLKKYTGDEFYPEGHYYFTTNKEPKEDLLKMNAKYAKYKNGKHFGWIAPATEWRIRLKERIAANPWAGIKKKKFNLEKDLPKIHSEGKLKYRKYQEKFLSDVKTLLSSNQRYTKSLIAPLGSGKTLMGLGAIELAGGKGIVVAPKYLHDQWKREAITFGFEVPLIITYESAHKYQYQDIDAVIFDENLRTKNPAANRSKACKALAANCKLAMGMTATPNSSKGAADWRHINTCHPNALPDEETAIKLIWGKNVRLDYVPASRQKTWVVDGWDDEAIAEFISPYVHMIDQKELKQSMPSVNYVKILLNKPSEYDDVLEGFYTERTFSKCIAQCRQLTSGFFTNDDDEVIQDNTIKLDWIRQFMEDNPEETIVIFSTHIGSQRNLEKQLAEFNPAVIVGDGRKTGPELKRFQDGLTKVMICSAQLTEGMNLHKVCRTAIFESNGLSPVMRKQAIGRIERPNSAWSGVTIYDLCCENTFDEKLLDLLEKHIDFSEKQILELLVKKEEGF
jgi:hypothetical protein